MNTVRKIPYNVNAQDSSIRRLECKKEETLSNVIKVLSWGNNKRIKTGGFLLSDQISKLRFTKPVKDPLFQFNSTKTYISPKHGRSLAVVTLI